MASDYGDESGEKMLDNFYRFGERMGISAMRGRADRLHQAFENAKQGAANGVAAEGEKKAEFAKLDMAEFREIEGYEEIKQIIVEKLRAHGVEPVWFNDEQEGREYLVFSLRDAHEVWDSFDELSKETGQAAELASEALKEKKLVALKSKEADKAREGEPALRDERPLEVRAQQAREASKALEGERPTSQTRDHGPRFQELRSK